ncbi:hypothetical protein [Natrinema sp. CGMCC1.2065]|uniref:hypothetical protein n=1 Tax=Natrinema sp. CGMCC1.2065 TaxID=3445767 RepID=UPI003F4A3700
MTGRRPIGLEDDNRALTYNIAVFLATIVIAFLLAMVLEPASDQMLDIAANETSRESSQQGQSYVRLAWTHLHLITVGFGAIQLIAAAAYEANVGGRL